ADGLSSRPARSTELWAMPTDSGCPALGWTGLGLWLDMVRVPPSGTWERRLADLYGVADDWVGAGKATEGEGMELIVRRYLGGFGPAAAAAIASWAGLPTAEVVP